MRNNSLLGKLGEDYAVKLLQAAGYKIIGRNFHSRFGEIDIIAQDNDTLVFVEVKARWEDKFGRPQEAVNTRKINSIMKTGEYFKLLNPQTPDLIRIDVVALTVLGNRILSAEIIKNVTS